MKNSKEHKISRRSFLAGTGSAIGFTVLPRYVFGGSGFTAPSEKLNVAVIGAGSQGINDMRALLDCTDAQVVAVCDVAEKTTTRWENTTGRAEALKIVNDYYSGKIRTKDYAGCKEFVDFRQMLDKEKNIDAVLIATPDHNHATATMWAIKNKKHVYCEKPLTYSIFEARKITQAAKEAGIVTQMGNQGHSGEGIRLTVEWIRDGVIGDVREVHAWSNHQGRWPNTPAERPKDMPPIPNSINWLLWLGPRPKRPYHSVYHPAYWRAWWDFGNSTIGDMACHNLDPAFWALDLGHPESVEASSSNFNDETAPVAAIYHYQFPARGKMPPVKVIWYTSGILPQKPEELEEDRQLTGGGNGILFIGDKGKIMCDGWGGTPQLIPYSKMKEYKQPEKTIPRIAGDHMQNFVDSCKQGTKACSDFSYSGPMTEVVLLGNVALRTGKKIYWDGVNMKATNAPEAERFIHPTYHNGWIL